jgi:hypothetical protein
MKRKLWAASAVLAGALLTACGGGHMVAAYGPPPPRYGVMGYAPGRWVRPPHARAVWVGPEWRREGRGYRFYRGYWR